MLVKVRSVVTVPISELVVAKGVVDTIDGVTAEIVLVVRADVIAVVVAMTRDSDRRGSVHFEVLIGRIRSLAVVVGTTLIWISVVESAGSRVLVFFNRCQTNIRLGLEACELSKKPFGLVLYDMRNKCTENSRPPRESNSGVNDI